jgi:thiamine-phosphate pyrophosphorylase
MTDDFGLYLVLTDPVAGYEACTEAAVDQCVRYVQLRMKGTPTEDVIGMGKRLRDITRGTLTRFIVNDNVEVARAVDADGVHLGQGDLTLHEARRQWPSEEPKLFGLSTHDEAQALAAVPQAPDYIGVGPLFATPTKQVADPVVGVERAATIIANSPLTCVAIGGLDPERLPVVFRSRVCNFAVVRHVCRHPKPGEPIRELMNLWREFRSGPETS